MGVPLSRELRARYGRRSIPIRKGDTVRVVRGSFIGREERVAKIDRRSYSVTVENLTGKTGDQKLKPLPIRPGHLLLTRLNLSDPWRRRILRVSDAEVAETEAAESAAAAPAPSTEVADAKPAEKEEAK